jgi:hypothetical protein
VLCGKCKCSRLNQHMRSRVSIALLRERDSRSPFRVCVVQLREPKQTRDFIRGVRIDLHGHYVCVLAISKEQHAEVPERWRVREHGNSCSSLLCHKRGTAPVCIVK